MEYMLHPRSTPAGSARRWTLAGLLAVVLALSAALIPALPAHSAHSATGGGVIYALVNEARAANGQDELARNTELDAVAGAWAVQLAAAGTLSHNPGYSAQIPGGWVSAGENVAQGQPSEAAMHDAWMNSSGHRANVLGDFTDIGVAFLAAGDTTWGVEVFASYPDEVLPTSPAPTPDVTPTPSTEPPPTPTESPAAAADVPAAPKGRTSAAPASSEEPASAEATPEPTPTATATSTTGPRAEVGRPASASSSFQAAIAEESRPADAFGTWLAVGIPSVTGAAAVAGAVVLLRMRGLIGPSGGRHTSVRRVAP
jgi:uncharacterized protein YkwD